MDNRPAGEAEERTRDALREAKTLGMRYARLVAFLAILAALLVAYVMGYMEGSGIA